MRVDERHHPEVITRNDPTFEVNFEESADGFRVPTRISERITNCCNGRKPSRDHSAAPIPNTSLCLDQQPTQI